MFTNILTLILFLVMLGVLITIHELGHFLVAKLFKVYVFEFSIGFGPKIFRFKKGESYYSLRALPLGGYVAMMGEDENIPEEFAGQEIDRSRSLVGVNRGKRALIMSAGIIMNLILGYGIFLFSNGALTQTKSHSLLEVSEASPAASLGIETGDWLVPQYGLAVKEDLPFWGVGTLNGEPEQYSVLFQPASFKQLAFGGNSFYLLKENAPDLLMNNKNSFYLEALTATDVLTFDAVVRKGDDGPNTTITLVYTTELVNSEDPSKGYTFTNLGFSFTTYTYRNSFVEAIELSNGDFTYSLTGVVKGIISLFTNGLEGMTGPVGIFTITTTTLTNYGLSYYLFYWGFISINLALFNLLPFPPLDGWHLLVVGVEAVTRRELNPRFKQIASLAGAGLLILLTIAILAKDLIALIGVIL